MAEIKISHFGQEVEVKKTTEGENISSAISTAEENMREQPKATKLGYSPRRHGKNAGISNENIKSRSLLKDSIKDVTDSSSSSLSLFDGIEKRKSLQVLQPSADGQKLLVGGKQSHRSKQKVKTHQKSTLSSSQKKLKHFLTKSSDDVESQSSSSEVETTTAAAATTTTTTTTTSSSVVKSNVTSSSDEAYALMVQDRAPEKYWELLAEERRKALEKTLEENMKLYEIIENLKAENATLREEANTARYFAMLHEVTKDDLPSSQD